MEIQVQLNGKEEFDVFIEGKSRIKELISLLEEEGYLERNLKHIPVLEKQQLSEEIPSKEFNYFILNRYQEIDTQLNKGEKLKIISIPDGNVFLILKVLPFHSYIFYNEKKGSNLNYLKYRITQENPEIFDGRTFLNDFLDLQMFSSTKRIHSFPEEKLIEDISDETNGQLIVRFSLIAGGPSFLVTRYFDKVLENETHSFETTIDNKYNRLNYWLGISKRPSDEIIESSKIMSVELIENSVTPKLIIKPISEVEQLNKDRFTVWRHEIIPIEKGFTSIILKVNVHENVPGFGIKKRTVLLVDKQIEVNSENPRYQLGHITEKNVSSLSNWNSQKRKELIIKISENKTGEVLSELAEMFFEDENVCNQLIILQAHWNDARWQYDSNIIEVDKWWLTQNKINYSLLNIIQEIGSRSRLSISKIKSMTKKIKSISKHD